MILKEKYSSNVMVRLKLYRTLVIVATLNLFGVLIFYSGWTLRRAGNLPEVVIHRELYRRNKVPDYALKQDLSGILFQGDGVSVKTPMLNTTVTISHIYSFSPDIKKAALKIFQAYTRENDILTMQPAILYRKGKIVTVTELRFQEEGRRRLTARDKATYLFLRTFYPNFTAVHPGILLQIDFPSTSTWTGAQKPYLFQSQDDVLLSFTARDETTQRIYYTSLDTEKLEKDYLTTGNEVPPLDVSEMAYIETPVGACLSPVFTDGHINMIYSYDPLRLIQCSHIKGCSFVVKEGDSDVTNLGILIGGSPLELYSWPYHVGVSNAKVIVKESKKPLYTSHLVVMAMEKPRILYISEPLSVHQNIIKTVTFQNKMAADRYISVSGIILETPDILSLAASINNFSNAVLRLTGLERLLLDIIQNDLMTLPSMRHNPPPGTVQRNAMELISEYLDTDVTSP